MTTTTIRIDGYPAGKLTEARELLAKAHGKLVKAAAKAGQAAPEAPAIVVLAERQVLRCRGCGRRGPDAGSWRLAPEGSLAHQWGLEYGDATPCDPLGFGSFGERPCTGFMRAIDVVDLEVTAARPRLAGWEFLAVVEALEGGNLLRGVPGAEVAKGELDAYRTGDAGRCDHCTTKRRRAETFIVRGDDDTLKQVGRSCLADFLGGKSPADMLASLTYEKMIRDLGDEGGSGGGGGRETYDPGEFMSWTAASIRLTGWCSRGAAREAAEAGGGKQATADHVQYLLTPPWSAVGVGAWQKARATYRPTDADVAKGAAALAWAQGLPGASDYEQNLALVAKQIRLDPKHAGILASAVSGYERMMARAAEQVRPTGTSAHVGTIGTRVDVAATVERVATVDTQYGPLHIHTMRDVAGNALVWKTASVRLEPGKTVAGKGTIKAHSEFRGEKQTELARCSLK